MDFNQFSRLEVNNGKNELQAQHVEMFEQQRRAEDAARIQSWSQLGGRRRKVVEAKESG